MKPILFFCCCFCLLSLPLLRAQDESQSACQKALDQAQADYRAGLLQRIPADSLENRCLVGFSPGEQIEALRLLINLRLYQDRPKDAQRLMRLLLLRNPDIEAQATDSREFEYLLAQFDRDPRRYLLIRAGMNVTEPYTLRRYSAGSLTDGRAIDYAPELGFGLSVMLEQPINRRWAIGLGLGFQQRSYQYTELLRTDADPAFDFARLTFREAQNWAEVPLQLRWMPTGWGRIILNRSEGTWLSPYVYGGVTGQWLLTASLIDLSRSIDAYDPSVADGSGGRRPVRDSSGVQATAGRIRLTGDPSLRHRLNLSWNLGVGLQLKIRRNYFLLDVQGSGTLRNLVVPAHRYRNRQLAYTFGYVASDFRQISFPLVSLGIRHMFYDPEMSLTRVMLDELEQRNK